MSSYIPEDDYGNRFRLPSGRPTTVTVLAVLHLVLGGLGLLFGLCGVAVLAAGPANFTPSMPPPPAGAKLPPFPTDINVRLQKSIESQIPFYNAIVMTQGVLGLILSAMLVIAGIGLLSMRPGARKLSLVYACGSMALQLAGLFFMAVFTLPAMSSFYKQMEQEFPAAAPLMAFSRVGMFASIVFVPIGLVYPTVVLVLLTRPRIVDAFANRQQVPELPDRDRAEDQSSPRSDFYAP